MLWVDTRKKCGYHLTTSAGDADPLRKRRLLATSSVNTHLLRCADMGYLALFSLTKLSSIDVKDIASFVKLIGWCFRVGKSCFKCTALALTNLLLPDLEELDQCRECVHMRHQNEPLCMLK